MGYGAQVTSMKVALRFGALRETEWYEYAIRFLLGGLVTAMTGAVAGYFGPVVGGLFLAFPAIFPASVTLIEKHQIKRSEEHGRNGTQRGREAAAADAAGAALGSAGLIVFGFLVWQFAPRVPTWVLLTGATFVWAAVALTIWIIRKKICTLPSVSRGNT